jgi:hypothetical protein
MPVLRGSRARNEVSWSSCCIPRHLVYEPVALSECFLIKLGQEITWPCLCRTNMPAMEVKLLLMIIMLIYTWPTEKKERNGDIHDGHMSPIIYGVIN